MQSNQISSMDFLPSNPKDLNQSSYWNKFFQSPHFKDGFEWYASFSDLQPYLSQYIKPKSPLEIVLVPGCGNSDLSEKICMEMGVEVVSVDYEKEVVMKMEEKKKEGVRVRYVEGDVTRLEGMGDGEVAYVVDKGTMDAIAVDDAQETKE